MPFVDFSSEKPIKAEDSLVEQYHSAKQKGLRFWMSYLSGRNPDLYVLGGHLVVRLDFILTDKRATEVASDEQYVIKASNSHYYGVVVEGPLE